MQVPFTQFSYLLNGSRPWLLVLLLAGSALFKPALAQDGPKRKLSGRVIDAQQNTPLGYASVRLFRQADSVFVTGGITAETGVFTLEAAPGTYYGLIEFVGYKPLRTAPIRLSPDQALLALGDVKLSAASKTLDEVVVQGEKSSMELTLDKRVFNVGKDLANSGGTAVDILSNVPSVAVDVEGNVSLRGSNSVRILVDGKPSGLVGIRGGNGLKSLQGSAIERIEIITNPSARYEAEGMGGIINIILKKERKEGFNGSFDLITGNPANFGAAANLNYRRKNLNFFVNYTASYRNTPGRSFQEQRFTRNDSTFLTYQNNKGKLKGQNNSARAGLDFFLSPSQTLTAAYTWRTSIGKRFTDIRYLDYLFSDRNLQTVTNRTQDETETEPNSEYALSYKKTFKREGHSLTADVRYIDNWEKSDQYFGENTFGPDGRGPARRSILQRSLNDETEKQLLFQLDYVQPFAAKGKFEAGLRSSSRDMTNDFSVTQQNPNGTWFQLPGLTNDFLYEERIHAAYGIVGNKTKKVSYQAGLRAEWTGVTTTLKQTNEVNPRTYANLFPSVHVSYEMAQQNQLQVSYSRRVRRPQYNDLSPFMTFSDARNFFSGNPDLDPEFTDAYEVGHIKSLEKATITSSIYYRHTTGKIIRIRRVDEQGNANTRPENLATEDAYGAEFTGSFNPLPWWKVDGSFNFFRAVIDGSNLDQRFQAKTVSWFTRATSRMTILKTTDVQLRGNYEAPMLTPQGRRKAIATLDLAMSRDIWANKATITLNVLDVFNSRRFRTITEGPNFYTYNDSQGRLRQINLTLNYRIRQAKKKRDMSSEGEMGG